MIDILSLVPPIDLHFYYKIVIFNGNHEANIRGEIKPFTSYLQGLSHEIDLAFEDMHRQL
jgi:hypothetical protein